MPWLKARRRKQRKPLLVAELTKLSEPAGIESLDDAKLKRELHERVADVKPLLAENTTQAPDAPEATRWLQDRDKGLR
jgi:hypothetical protein